MSRPEDTSIQYIKGVGPNRKRLFTNLGVETVEDLLYLFPRRYEDRSKLTPIKDIKLGEWQTVIGKVLKKRSRKSWHTRKSVLEVTVGDGVNSITCVWFNMPYLDHYFKPDAEVVLFGKVDRYKDRIQMVSPEYEILGGMDQNLNTGRIVPIYPLTKGITQRALRKTISAALEKYKDDLNDILPVSVRNKHKLINIKRSIANIHFPKTEELQEEAIRRVSFEEFFLFQVSVNLRRQSILKKQGIAHTVSDELMDQFSKAFPFMLTNAQFRVVREIQEGLKNETPMLRLLQGDVGSGKTLVALFGCIVAYKNQKQSAIMAPTEILARQHFDNINRVLKDGPFADVKVELLISGIPKKDRTKILNDLKNGEIDCVIGTHALISEDVAFKDLSFVVIDEQHKFGVRQRALLSKKGINPDVLIMTATPIPRTLILTLYGDLDVSTIDEMPKNRGKITTELFSHDNAKEAYKEVREKINQGNQAYIVYPIIEESEKSDLKAAQSMYTHFKKNEFKGLRLGLIHGQMPRAETEEIMRAFNAHEIDVLVATTILEVGVDVPNANVMVIEHAERFGLSQLHQLRGRVGRGMEDALCILIADPISSDAQSRVDAIIASNDGFKIAENDLMIRGPGQYFGRHQHGLNELRVINPTSQLDVLEVAREEAKDLVSADPELNDQNHVTVLSTIRKRYPTYLKDVQAG